MQNCWIGAVVVGGLGGSMAPCCRPRSKSGSRSGSRPIEEEISIFELIFAGSFLLMLTGFLSGINFYACFMPWPDPDDPDMLPRPFYLIMGLLLGYVTFRVAKDIYTELLKKLRRFLGKIGSRKDNKSRKDKEEEEEDEDEEEEEERCPICLEDLESGSGFVVRLRVCMHRFHRGCIYKWLSRSPCCPTCRSSATCNNYLLC